MFWELLKVRAVRIGRPYFLSDILKGLAQMIVF